MCWVNRDGELTDMTSSCHEITMWQSFLPIVRMDPLSEQPDYIGN